MFFFLKAKEGRGEGAGTGVERCALRFLSGVWVAGGDRDTRPLVFPTGMKTRAGLTCSATATNASLRSAMGLAPGSGVLGGAVVCWAARSDSAAPPFFGRSRDDANASPSTKAIATSDPNFNQSRVRTVIAPP